MFKTIEQILVRKPVILQLLKFACIGALNTALDFVVLNFFTTWLGVTHGVTLGFLNVIGVVLAILQSYYWNRSWTFGLESGVSLIKHFFHLILVGGLGFLTFVGVLLGVQNSAQASFFGILLFAFVVIQTAFLISFRLPRPTSSSSVEFEKFVLVSLIGVGINSVVLVSGVWFLGQYDTGLKEEMVKNLAKFAAVFVSLVWNFVGYKFFVFKR